MRNDIFNNWLQYLDNGFRIQQRQVIMLVDNAPSHNFVKSTNYKNENEDEESDSEFSETESISSQNSFNDDDDDDNNNNNNNNNDNNNNYQLLKLTNIRLIYLPSNTTAHLQPMDAGIINNFKV